MEYELVYGLPKAEVLAQMAEELTEAAQAALKLRRAMDGANPTPKSIAECKANLHEELGDVYNCITALTNGNEDLYYKFIADCQVNCIPKMERWEARLEAANIRPYAVAVGSKDAIKDIITVSAINPAPAKKLAKELYHKMHPTTPIEQLEADIVERGSGW